jgi:hypothetical protein
LPLSVWAVSSPGFSGLSGDIDNRNQDEQGIEHLNCVHHANRKVNKNIGEETEYLKIALEKLYSAH